MTVQDRRTVRTRQWLRTALLELLRETPYAAITIQDIVDRADTARVTFYRHYQDKEALLLDCLEMLYQEVTPYLPEASLRETIVSDQPPILAFYQHVADNQTLYRTIFSEQIPSVIRRRIHRYIADTITTSIQVEGLADQFSIPLEVVANHLATSSLGNIIWWLENDTPYPIDVFTRATHWLNMVGVVGLLTTPVNVRIPDLMDHQPTSQARADQQGGPSTKHRKRSS